MTDLAKQLGITEKNFMSGGYRKLGVKAHKYREIKSRTLDSSGKMVQGEAGMRLLKKKLDKQKYYERNK